MQHKQFRRLTIPALLATLAFPTAYAIDLSVEPATPAPDVRDTRSVDGPRLANPEFDAAYEDITVTSFDVWDRIRKGFAIPDLNSPLVANHVNWYSSRPDYIQRTTQRASRYLFHVVQELERRGMPMELALLPFIESAFNPQAYSSAKAAGMWQFIPSTGRDYNLKQNIFRDERRDVLASTDAALNYLQKLYGMFGDWQLALAAYNWGEGSVSRAIAKAQAAGRDTDYNSLSAFMPAETRNYYPKLQAVKNLVSAPAQYGLTLPVVENQPYFVSINKTRDIDVKLAARLAETLKSFPLELTAPRPIDEAISTAGGVAWSALDERLMLKARPGVFCAGEMLDWEAPTGGYLLTACCATGRWAARGALEWLSQRLPAT